MQVLVRCDASTEIGSGHVIRCLTLADALADKGARVSFVCRRLPGELSLLIERRGYSVRLIEAHCWQDDAEMTGQSAAVPGGVDWLIVDHYGLDARFEQRLRSLAARVLVIDDLADRPHDCELLLDQNLCGNLQERYHGLVPATCKTLLGPRFALLRPEFRRARRTLRARRGELQRLLISFGGSDQSNETAKALAAWDLLADPGLLLDVVVGASNPHAAAVQAACAARPGCHFHNQVDNMAELMSRADLAIGSGGSTTWERCYLGLPSLTVVVAPNQLELTEAVAATGAAWNLGRHADLSPRVLAERITRLRGAPELLAQASACGFSLMGGAAGQADHPLVALMYGGRDGDTASDAA
jgi:UDP-2,4-diacetamido-2,4,6-trideoxy-beta-L-altropyranose hydrolase